MRHHPLLLRAAVVLTVLCAGSTGCGGDPPSYSGYPMYDYMALDGSARDWKYNNESDAAGYALFVEMLDRVKSGNMEIATLEYSKADKGDVLHSIRWSTDSVNGVLIHGYNLAGGGEVTYDPPVLMADTHMVALDEVVTESNGYTFTSIFDGVTGCGTDWAPDWDEQECVQITLSDGDADPTTNGIITGTYLLVPRWGIAIMTLDGGPGTWNLASAHWTE